jgi:hypothetical protein
MSGLDIGLMPMVRAEWSSSPCGTFNACSNLVWQSRLAFQPAPHERIGITASLSQLADEAVGYGMMTVPAGCFKTMCRCTDLQGAEICGCPGNSVRLPRYGLKIPLSPKMRDSLKMYVDIREGQRDQIAKIID